MKFSIAKIMVNGEAQYHYWVKGHIGVAGSLAEALSIVGRLI